MANYIFLISCDRMISRPPEKKRIELNSSLVFRVSKAENSDINSFEFWGDC